MPFCWPTSYSAQMFGWLRLEIARASRSKRSRSCGLLERCSGRTLTATMRSSRVSLARYTSPIPPAPIEEMISYGPSRVEGWRDIAVACSLPHQSAAWNAGCAIKQRQLSDVQVSSAPTHLLSGEPERPDKQDKPE